MLKRLLPLGLALVLTVGYLPAVETAEPPNLYTLKQQINAYVASGQYGKDVVKVAAEANAYLVKSMELDDFIAAIGVAQKFWMEVNELP